MSEKSDVKGKTENSVKSWAVMSTSFPYFIIGKGGDGYEEIHN